MTNQSTDTSEGIHRVVIVALITALCLAGDSMLYIVLPLYWHEAGFASLWEVGMILSVNRLARLPINPLVGWIYTRISIRTGMVLAALLALGTTIGYATAHHLLIWIFLRAVWGLSWSLLKLGAFATIVDVAGDNRGYLVGRYNGLYRLGSLAGMLGGGFLADAFGLRLTACVCAALAIPAIIIAFLYVPSINAQPQKKKEPIVWRELPWLSGGILPALGTAFIVAMVLQGILASSLGPMVRIHLGTSVTVITFVIGCASIAGILQAS